MRILRWIPRKLVHAFMASDIWHHVRYLKLRASGQPHMEMNPWKKASLEGFIEKHAAEILHCQKEPEAPESLESYVYFIRKTKRQ